MDLDKYVSHIVDLILNHIGCGRIINDIAHGVIDILNDTREVSIGVIKYDIYICDRSSHKGKYICRIASLQETRSLAMKFTIFPGYTSWGIEDITIYGVKALEKILFKWNNMVGAYKLSIDQSAYDNGVKNVVTIAKHLKITKMGECRYEPQFI